MRKEERSSGGGNSSSVQRVPKGCVPVLVGFEKETERFVVHTKLFKHPCVKALLDMAAQEFGYEQKGILRIPCDIEHFRQVLEVISKACQ